MPQERRSPRQGPGRPWDDYLLLRAEPGRVADFLQHACAGGWADTAAVTRYLDLNPQDSYERQKTRRWLERLMDIGVVERRENNTLAGGRLLRRRWHWRWSQEAFDNWRVGRLEDLEAEIKVRHAELLNRLRASVHLHGH